MMLLVAAVLACATIEARPSESPQSTADAGLPPVIKAESTTVVAAANDVIGGQNISEILNHRRYVKINDNDADATTHSSQIEPPLTDSAAARSMNDYELSNNYILNNFLQSSITDLKRNRFTYIRDPSSAIHMAATPPTVNSANTPKVFEMVSSSEAEDKQFSPYTIYDRLYDVTTSKFPDRYLEYDIHRRPSDSLYFNQDIGNVILERPPSTVIVHTEPVNFLEHSDPYRRPRPPPRPPYHHRPQSFDNYHSRPLVITARPPPQTYPEAERIPIRPDGNGDDDDDDDDRDTFEYTTEWSTTPNRPTKINNKLTNSVLKIKVPTTTAQPSFSTYSSVSILEEPINNEYATEAVKVNENLNFNAQNAAICSVNGGGNCGFGGGGGYGFSDPQACLPNGPCPGSCTGPQCGRPPPPPRPPVVISPVPPVRLPPPPPPPPIGPTIRPPFPLNPTIRPQIPQPPNIRPNFQPTGGGLPPLPCTPGLIYNLNTRRCDPQLLVGGAPYPYPPPIFTAPGLNDKHGHQGHGSSTQISPTFVFQQAPHDDGSHSYGTSSVLEIPPIFKRKKHQVGLFSSLFGFRLPKRFLKKTLLKILPFLALINPISFGFWSFILSPMVVALAGGTVLALLLYPWASTWNLFGARRPPKPTIIIHRPAKTPRPIWNPPPPFRPWAPQIRPPESGVRWTIRPKFPLVRSDQQIKNRMAEDVNSVEEEKDEAIEDPITEAENDIRFDNLTNFQETFRDKYLT